MAEKIFFEQDDMLVTNSRFKVGNETYIIRNITSVKVNVIPGKKGKPGQPATNYSFATFLCTNIIIFFLFMIITIITYFIHPAIAGFFMFMGFIALFNESSYKNTPEIPPEPDEPDTHELMLKTSGGEIKALVTKNKVLIDYLVNALNDAFNYGS